MLLTISSSVCLFVSDACRRTAIDQVTFARDGEGERIRLASDYFLRECRLSGLRPPNALHPQEGLGQVHAVRDSGSSYC